MEITIEELKKVRDRLHYGDMDKISKSVNYSAEYVSGFFLGKHPINRDNMSIIHEAMKLIKDFEEKEAVLKDELSKFQK